MLRTLFASAIDYRADRDRRGDLAAEHRAPLRSLCDDLINGEEHEVNARMDDDRSISAKRSAQCRTRTGKLGNRRIDDAITTELAVEISH